MADDRAIIREGFGKPSYDDQVEALRAQVSPETGKRLFTKFGPLSPNVYEDRKKYKSHYEADAKWLKMLIKHVYPGVRIWVATPSVLASREIAVRGVLMLLREKGVARVIRCDKMQAINLGSANSQALLEFIADASRAPMEARLAAMRRRRLETGQLGGSTGRDPKYTDAQILKIKEAWLDHQGTIKELVLVAGRAIGQESVAERTLYRLAKVNKWPPRGSQPTTVRRTAKPRKRK